jgi:ABC-2 type transport system permease protein
MRQLLTIAVNAFMELVRQPIFLLLMTTSASFIVFLSSVYYFGLGDDQIMIKQSLLAVMFMAGLFGAVLSASAAVAHEIRTGTALAVLAKPVGRAQFLIGKFIGLAGALTVLTFVNFLAALIASRLAFDAYGDPDEIALSIFFGSILLAYALGGFTNFFLRRPFVPDAVFFLIGLVTVSFVVVNFINKDGAFQTFAAGVDWRLTPASILILFALWILAAIALACSTRWEVIPTLAICSAVFLLGLMSDYFFGIQAQKGVWWATVLYAITPNWQVLWLSDALEAGRSIPWSYVGKAVVYVAGFLGAALALALLMFEERELS